jgi:sec-independent protein translocase protein TatB
MFDFAWSEIALIGVVALIAIGPKDMPLAIKAVTSAIKKARRMAAEFQTHVDEMMREADLDEVRKQVNEIRNFNFKGEIERTVDPDGSLRQTFASNPLAPDPPKAAVATFTREPQKEEAKPATIELPSSEPVPEPVPASDAEPEVSPPVTASPEAEREREEAAPAFIPPACAKPPPLPPDFVPPVAAKQTAPTARF